MNRFDAGFSSGKQSLAILGIVVAVVVAVVFLNRNGSEEPVTVASAPDRTEAHLTEREQRAAEPREAAPVPETAPQVAEEPARTEGEVRLHGQVTEAGGGYPISNAQVLVFLDREGALTGAARETTTDSEGNYEVILSAHELPRRSTVVAAKAEGYAAERHEVHRGAPRVGASIRQNFALRPGGAISGVVRNERGYPVSGAQVALAKFPETEQLYSLLARGENPHRFFPAVETGAEGRFQLEGIPRDPATRLYVEANNYLKHVTDPVMVGTRDLEIILEDGEVSLRGRVFNADGTPATEVPVRTLHGGAAQGPAGMLRSLADREAQLTSLYHTTTDGQGRYEFPALRSGTQSVLAGFGAPSSRSVAGMINIGFGDDAELNLRFGPTRVVRGVVVDRASGEPVPQVTLTANPVGSPLAELYAAAGGGSGDKQVTTNQLGEFELEIEPRAEQQLGGETRIYYKVPVHYDPNAGDTWRAEALSQRQIERLDEGGASHTIEVGRSQLIRGRVVAMGGEEGNEEQPVAGATVRWTGEERPDPVAQMIDDVLKEAAPTSKEVQTLGDGSFELWAAVDPDNPGRRRGRGRQVNRLNVVEAQLGEIKGEETIEFTDGQPQEVKITLQQVGTLRGRAVGPDEESVPGAEIQVAQVGRAMAGGTPELLASYTDEEGNFTIENIPTGRTMVIANAVPGFVPPEQRNVSIDPGDENELTLYYERSFPFEGIVVDGDDNPIRGAEVTLTQPRGGFLQRIMGGGTVTTNSEGRFELENLPETADALAFRVGHTNYETREVRNILPEDSPLTITLQGRSSVEFTAHSGNVQRTSFEYEIRPQGRPASDDPRMMMMRGGRGGQSGSGTVHLQSSPVKVTVEPGRYTLHVHGISDEDGQRDGTYGAEDFQVRRGETEPVELEVQLSPRLVVQGRVIDDEGNGLPDAEVQIHQAGRGGAAARWQRGRGGNDGIVDPQATDGRGYFRFEELTAGRFEIRAEKEDYVQREEVTIRLQAGEDPEPVTVELVQGGTIHGQVTGVDGRPMTNGWVYADVSGTGGTAPGWGRGRGNAPAVNDRDHRDQLDGSGNYRLTALPPGRHRVAVFDEDYGMEIMYLDVQLGVHETAKVDFDMQGLVQVDGSVDVEGMSIGRGGLGGTSFRLIPEGESEGGKLLSLDNRQNFRAYLRPGRYELHVSPRGINTDLPTGATVELVERRPRQSADIRVGLHEMDVLVVSPDGADFRGGDARIRFDGLNRSVTFRLSVSERITRLRFMPEGIYGEQGRLNGRDGRVYVPLEEQIGPRGDNILTFVSEEELNGT